MDKSLTYCLKFYASSNPFVVPKIRATTPRSKIREGVNLISSMQGYIQVYYLEKLGLELTKRNMSKSIFLTNITQVFRNGITNLVPLDEQMAESISEKNEVWVLNDTENLSCRKL